jgi:serine kinase of HPr protein (carbohydrate metabolism regulator)
MNVHGTGIVLAGTGVMLRGPSGSGKSLLALVLLDAFSARGVEAALVGDDRLDLAISHGLVTMTAPASIAGLIELRGRGILSRPYRPSSPVGLVVDLVESLERMPEKAAFSTEILGVTLPRCPVPQVGIAGAEHQVLLIREALAMGDPDSTKTA